MPILLGKFHFLLYLLVAAMRPRMLVTLDEELKPLPVAVRVGQAVDVVELVEEEVALGRLCLKFVV